ncbi:MAG: NUDIX hydrolase, partial [Legionellales bacterium]|nr:NUDIX hydrolase [Legionellales bacterium]
SDALKIIFANQNIANTIIQHKVAHGKISNSNDKIWGNLIKLQKIKKALSSDTFNSTTKPNLANRPVKTYYNGTVQNVATMVRYINADTGESFYLFGKRKSRNPAKRKWAFPGGGVDGSDYISNGHTDSSYKNAALRELREETKINGKHYIAQGGKLEHVSSVNKMSIDYRDNTSKPHETHFYILDLKILSNSEIKQLHRNTRAGSDLRDAKFISRNMIRTAPNKEINIPGTGWTNMVYPNNVDLVNTNEKT